SSGADGRLAPHRLRRAIVVRLPRLRRGVRRTHARADVWGRVRGVPRRRPALDTADDPMAVEMIGGPRLCEPLLATALGRFTGAASEGSPDERSDIRGCGSPHIAALMRATR